MTSPAHRRRRRVGWRRRCPIPRHHRYVRAERAPCLDQRRGRLRLSPVPGRAGFGSQGRRVAAGLAQGLFPAIKGSATEAEGITGRRFAMIREETEDFETLLSIFGSHLPKHALVKTWDALKRLPGKSLCSVSDMLDLHGSPSASECQRYLSLYTTGWRDYAKLKAYAHH